MADPPIAPVGQEIQDMIARNEAPVKAAYMRRKDAADVKPLLAAAGVPAPSTAAGPAKSKRKQHKDMRESRALDICKNFILGKCTFGAKCRFSHDLDAYLAAKPPDLAGRCPWALQPTCPHGTQCRWAGSHPGNPSGPAPAGAASLPSALHAATTAAAAPDAADAAPPTSTAAVAAGASEEAAAAAAGASEAAAAAGVGEAAAAAGANGTPAAAEGVVAGQSQPPGAVGPGGLSDVPQGMLPLQPAAVVQRSVNSMSKDVQVALWKHRYDFSRSDAVLKSLGSRLSFKPARADGQQGGRPAAQPAPSKPGAAASAPPPAQQPAAAAASAAAAPDANMDAALQDAAPAVQGGKAGAQRALLPEPEQDSQPAAHPPGAAQPANPVGEEPAAEAAQPPTKRLRTEAGSVGEGAAPSGAGASSMDSECVVQQPQDPGSNAASTAAPMSTDVAPELAAAAEAASGTQAAAGGAPAVGPASVAQQSRVAQAAAYTETPLRTWEKKAINLRGKTVLAPLTTVGNLPFRRVCKRVGADVTIGEMALATNLLQAQPSEWALLKRHPSEDLFGVQIAGGFPDAISRTCQLIDECCESVDFVDINMGCPLDLICDRGAGSALLLKPKRIEEIARAADRSMRMPLTLKTRKGYNDGQDITHTFVGSIRSWGAIALTLHGRTRQQRYSRLADWDYIQQCAQLAEPTGLQLVGNGDVFSYTDWNAHLGDGAGPLASCMVARGALIKPWVFTEIKEQRHWDISAGERLDLLRAFVGAGLEHWGSDTRGVETCRKFLLEWLSYTHRYIPVALLEVVPQQLHWRAPAFVGRSDLETLMSSDDPAHWIQISEMLLGPVPTGFSFQPKHKSNAYSSSNAATGGQDKGEEQAEG